MCLHSYQLANYLRLVSLEMVQDYKRATKDQTRQMIESNKPCFKINLATPVMLVYEKYRSWFGRCVLKVLGKSKLFTELLNLWEMMQFLQNSKDIWLPRIKSLRIVCVCVCVCVCVWYGLLEVWYQFWTIPTIKSGVEGHVGPNIILHLAQNTEIGCLGISRSP